MEIDLSKCLCQSGLTYEKCCKNKKIITPNVFDENSFVRKLLKDIYNYKLPCIFEENGKPYIRLQAQKEKEQARPKL